METGIEEKIWNVIESCSQLLDGESRIVLLLQVYLNFQKPEVCKVDELNTRQS